MSAVSWWAFEIRALQVQDGENRTPKGVPGSLSFAIYKYLTPLE
jgi:hypothetical protein